jgi:uncharacterized phage protein (TIGR01671 family)
MREIKFRAWDKRINKLFYDFSKVLFALSSMEYDDFILMQYTGLKDKNGKEIYEGDIVERTRNKDLIGKIIFYPCYGWSAIWKYKNPTNEQRKDFFLTCTIADNEFKEGKWIWKTEVEVIGNIYENPELLGDKNE